MGEDTIGEIGTLIDILHLEAALTEDPVLQTGDSLVLIHAKGSVEIEEIIRANELQAFIQRDGTRDVSTTASGASVLTFYIFPMYVEVLGFIVEAHRPAVALVVVAFLDIRIIGRVGDSMSTTYLSCGNEVEPFYGTVFQSSDEVLLFIAVFLVDTLSVHHLCLVAELAVVGLTKDGESKVTTILHTHQGVAATASQIGHAF